MGKNIHRKKHKNNKRIPEKQNIKDKNIVEHKKEPMPSVEDKEHDLNASVKEEKVTDLKQKKIQRKVEWFGIAISFVSMVLAIISIIIAKKIADNTNDFTNKNAALDFDFADVRMENDSLDVTISVKQGKVKKVCVADIDENNVITYSKQSVVANNDKILISIPTNVHEESANDDQLTWTYDYTDTKQFALVLYDYNSNIYCYYVIFLAKPHVKEGLAYEIRLRDKNENTVAEGKRNIDNMENWKDHSLIIDCAVINYNTVKNMIDGFDFIYDYPLFKAPQTIVGENGEAVESNPILQFNYSEVSADDIFYNIGVINQDINPSLQ